MSEFYMIHARKVIKILEFLWYLPEKFSKFPNFTWFLPEKCPNFMYNCPKNIFPRIIGGTCPPPPPDPVSYAYAIDRATSEIIGLGKGEKKHQQRFIMACTAASLTRGHVMTNGKVSRTTEIKLKIKQKKYFILDLSQYCALPKNTMDEPCVFWVWFNHGKQ